MPISKSLTLPRFDEKISRLLVCGNPLVFCQFGEIWSVLFFSPLSYIVMGKFENLDVNINNRYKLVLNYIFILKTFIRFDCENPILTCIYIYKHYHIINLSTLYYSFHFPWIALKNCFHLISYVLTRSNSWDSVPIIEETCYIDHIGIPLGPPACML